MKKYYLALLITLYQLIAWGQQPIIAAEYFYDTDPGTGNATAITVTNGMIVTETVTTPPITLEKGLHQIYLRVKDADNNWSLCYRDKFFVFDFSEAAITPAEITDAEYFFDTDPGIGNATAIPVTNGLLVNETITTPAITLGKGLHKLHVRVKDEDGDWSLYYRDSFFVFDFSNSGETPAEIAAAEYFIDSDPGVGNANAIAITNGMIISETVTTTAITENKGVHWIHVRVQDENGKWSLYYKERFYVFDFSNATPAPTEIIAAEYFIDDDPGVGLATDIPIPSGMLLNENLTVSVPETLDYGMHKIQVRVKDQDDNWSLYYRDDFEIITDNCTGVSKKWNGSSWNAGGTAPSNVDYVVLEDDYNTSIHGNIEACNCTIRPGVKLTISANEYIQLTDHLVNNGEIEILHEGSLVQVNDNGLVLGKGNYKIHKTTSPYTEYDYTYWSSPTVNATINDVFVNNSTLSEGTTTNSTNASELSRIYHLDTAAFNDGNNDAFDDENDDWVVASGEMIPGKGYIALGAGADFPFNADDMSTNLEQSVFFEGKVNTADIEIPVVLDNDNTDNFENQNLIGNPYPSAIDINKLMEENASVLQGTFYFWTHDSPASAGYSGPEAYNFSNDDYATATSDGIAFNPVSGGSQGTAAPQFIASGQGFIANVNNSGIIKFTNAMRVTGSNDNFKSDVTTELNRFHINLSNENGVFRQILIGFYETGSPAFDQGLDGKRMPNGNNTDFYSLISEDDGHYAIQILGSFDNSKTIPLGIEIVEAMAYQISIQNVEGVFNTTQTVYLEDFYTNTIHNLNTSNYTFTTEIGEAIEDRFQIRFTDDTTAISENELRKIVIYPNPSNGIVNLALNGISKNIHLKITDLAGKIVHNYTHNATEEYTHQLDLSNLASGIYLLKISTNNKQITKKLVLE